MALNVVLIPDHYNNPFVSNKDDKHQQKQLGAELSSRNHTGDCKSSYIEKYQQCLNSMVTSSELYEYKNNSYTSWVHTNKLRHHIIIPKVNTFIDPHCYSNVLQPKTKSLLRFYQLLLPGTNVLIFLININEEKNYPFSVLKEWKTFFSKAKLKPNLKPSNPHHMHKSYQLFQRMMIGIPHFIHPPKYLCIMFCGAQSVAQFNEKKV